MKTSIVIVTHNLWEMTKACLTSIRECTPEEHEIILVDNGSTDETVEQVKANFPQVALIINDHNQGFPKAANQGIRQAAGDYILLLNNDTIVTPGWLGAMIRPLEADPQIGMVGPLSNQVSGEQQITVTYSELSGLPAFAEEHCRQHAGQTKLTRRLVGFCLLIRKQVLDQIGLLDERFGLGNYEDDDLCMRARLEGYKLAIAMDSFIHHEGHATFRSIGNNCLSILLAVNEKRARDKWNGNLIDLLYQNADLSEAADSPSKRPTVSLCMIVKNEQDNIDRCLSSIADLVDEIVIVDTGSTDKTKEVVARYGALIHEFAWIDDFAAARNFAFSKAACDYIMWLDADDILLPADREKFIQVREQLTLEVDSVTMLYHLSFDADGNAISSLRRNRLVKRSRNFKWHGAVHEYLAVSGHVIDSPVAVSHMGDDRESDRNLRIYEKRLAGGEPFEPRDMLYYGNELREHGRFQEAVEYYEQFLRTDPGWVEDHITACLRLAECYGRLGEEQKQLESLFKQFTYDLPRAETCCQIGAYFMEKAEWNKAVFWYKTAVDHPDPSNSWTLTHSAYSTWLPHIQLCVCYDRLGEREKAFRQHELSYDYNPNHPSVQYNENYFRMLFADQQEKRPPSCLLSLLIASVPQRLNELGRLIKQLEEQTEQRPVEILISLDNKKRTIGSKRNNLLKQAKGRYVAFLDDDDHITPNYVSELLSAIEQNPDADCIVFDVEVRHNGQFDRLCKYDKDYRYGQDDQYYYRKPNHLMCYAKRIVRNVDFADISYGEDDEWGERAAQRIEKQTRINEVLYVYDWKQKASDWYRNG